MSGSSAKPPASLHRSVQRCRSTLDFARRSPPISLDGIYYANQAELNTQFPDIGSAGFGRKWFDIPRKDFWKEAEQADGDDSLLGLVNPPKLMEVLDAICGGAGDEVRCVGIQPRTVPPDGEGGYTAWHRTSALLSPLPLRNR